MFKVWEEIGKQEIDFIANDFLASFGARGRFQECIKVLDLWQVRAMVPNHIWGFASQGLHSFAV